MPKIAECPPGYAVQRFSTGWTVLRFTPSDGAWHAQGPNFTRRYTAVQAAWRMYNHEQMQKRAGQ